MTRHVLSGFLLLAGVLFAGLISVRAWDRCGPVIITRYVQAFEIPVYSTARLTAHYLSGGALQDTDALLRIERERNRTGFQPYARAVRPLEMVGAIEKSGWTLRDNPVWHPREPFDWGANPNGDRNWHFSVNAMEFLDPYIAAYLETGEKRYFNTAYKTILDWIEFNLVQGRDNAFKWYDMAAGLRAARISFIYSEGLRNEWLPDEHVMLLLGALDMHAQVLANPRLLARNNHALFQMLGLAAVCEAAPVLHRCGKARSWAIEKFLATARRQFTHEGIHVEHSSQYHPWAVLQIATMLDLGYFGEVDRRFLELAGSNAIHFFYPDGQMHLLGDSGAQHVCSISEMHVALRFLCSGGVDGEPPAETFHWFPESGYAVVRSSWNVKPLSKQSFLFVNAAFHSQVHKHADDLSVLWYDAGRPILIDSGKYSYDYGDPWRQYFASTRAHNTVEIDGGSYSTSLEDAYGSALKGYEWSDEAVMIIAQTEHARVSVGHKRIVVFLPGRLLVVVDVMDGGKAVHEYAQWFHLHESLEVSDEGTHFTVSSAPDGEHVAKAVFYTDSAGATEISKGQTDPRIQGWVSRKYMQKLPRYALANRTRASTAVLVAAFQVGGGVPEIRLEGGVLVACAGETGLRVELLRESLQQFDCQVADASL